MLFIWSKIRVLAGHIASIFRFLFTNVVESDRSLTGIWRKVIQFCFLQLGSINEEQHLDVALGGDFKEMRISYQNGCKLCCQNAKHSKYAYHLCNFVDISINVAGYSTDSPSYCIFISSIIGKANCFHVLVAFERYRRERRWKLCSQSEWGRIILRHVFFWMHIC